MPESTVRVNVTRLQKDGWITRSRNGRESVYALTDAAWNMLDEGRDRIFNRTTRSWDSHWSMVVYSLPETQRALRETARKELTWLGFGRLANSVWINPHDRLHEAKQTLAHPEADLHLLHTRSAGGLAEDRAMAHTCWDLTGLAHDYETFLQLTTIWPARPLGSPTASAGCSLASTPPGNARLARRSATRPCWSYTVNQIAAELGVTRPTIYRHPKSTS